MYPLLPKSTARIKAGQFWGVPIEGRGFGCGVILAIERKLTGKRDTRRFLAGLLDWSGPKHPTSTQIVGRRVIAYGFAHLKTITENGGALIGEVEPWWEWPPEIQNMNNIPTWGYSVVSILAEKYHRGHSESSAAPNGGPAEGSKSGSGGGPTSVS